VESQSPCRWLRNEKNLLGVRATHLSTWRKAAYVDVTLRRGVWARDIPWLTGNWLPIRQFAFLHSSTGLWRWRLLWSWWRRRFRFRRLGRLLSRGRLFRRSISLEAPWLV
jgi:hypothetical protein